MIDKLKKLIHFKNTISFVFITFIFLNLIVFIIVKQPEEDYVLNKIKTPFPAYDSNGISGFTKKTENHIVDYLPFKYSYIGLSNWLKINLFHSLNTTNNVIVGKNNWLFYNACIYDSLGMNEYYGYSPWHTNQLHKVTENITTISNWCNRNSIKFKVIICPNKQSVYSNYLPTRYNKQSQNRYEQLINELPYTLNLTKIFNDYTKESNHLLYYKTDTHWNQLGAYIATKELCKDLNLTKEQYQTFINIYINDSLINHGMDLANMLALKNEYSDIFTTIEFKQANYKKIPHLVILHDSFIESMMPSLNQLFDTITQRHLYADGIPTPEYLIQHKTDVFVIELVERYKELLTGNIHPDYYK